MDPLLLLQLAMQGGGYLYGATRKDNSTRKLLEMVAAYSSPHRILADANDYYSAFMRGPAYTYGMRNIAGAQNTINSQFASSAASRGLAGSGISAAQQALGAGYASNARAGLLSNAWNSALQTAQQIATSRLQGAGYLKGPRDMQAETMGALMDALGKMDFRKFRGPDPNQAAMFATLANNYLPHIGNW